MSVFLLCLKTSSPLHVRSRVIFEDQRVTSDRFLDIESQRSGWHSILVGQSRVRLRPEGACRVATVARQFPQRYLDLPACRW